MTKPTHSDRDKVEWMQLRTEGFTCVEIAERFSASATYIRAATNRIVLADMEHHDDMIVFGDHDGK